MAGCAAVGGGGGGAVACGWTGVVAAVGVVTVPLVKSSPGLLTHEGTVLP